MTTREVKHRPEDLRDASDDNGPALDAGALESLDRGLADVAEGRVKRLDQYERERGCELSCRRP
jgi:hypothetical protein